MALITSSIPNLINGVSQQPFALRLATQCEEQINGDSSVTEGLRKRPGTRKVKKLVTSLNSNSLIHTINRDAVEQYQVIFDTTGVRVFDMAGTEKTVSYGSGAQAYITNSNPKANLTVLTVADYTFVVNKTVTVASGTTRTPARTPEALVWVRTGDYKKRYGITIDGTTWEFQTSTANTSANNYDPDTIKTDWIAKELADQIPSATYTVVRDGSVMTIRRENNADFSIKVRDSLGDQGMVLVKGSIQRFNSLPDKAISGFLCKVIGADDSGFTDYYVQYQSSPGTTGYVWNEAAKPDELNSLDASTMPHVLIRNSDGTFTFQRATWTTRTVGDLVSDPMPSFVGRQIKDVFFHRNRLGFLTGENVVLSADGEFFRFFRESVVQVLDTDPIDIAISHTKVSILNHAVSFSDGLLLFAGQTQFQIGKPELLTPKTISVQPLTEYEYNSDVEPAAAGNNIYFLQKRGSYSAIRELYVDQDTATASAPETSAHVPKFVPSNILKVVTSTTENIMLLLPTSGNELYVYRWYIADKAKVQSAWSKWTFPGVTNIRNIDFIESTLWMVMERSNGVYLEKAQIEVGQTDSTYFSPHLDHTVTDAQCTLSYNSTSNVTTVTLPADFLTTTDAPGYKLVAWAGDAGRQQGEEVPFTRVSNTQFTCTGNLTKFRLGRPYDFTYRFSQFVTRAQANGGGQEAMAATRLQLRNLSISYANSGYFTVSVTPKNRQTYTYMFNGRTVGDTLVNTLPRDTGTFKVPLVASSEGLDVVVTSSSWLPVYLLSAEWSAIMNQKGRRV